MCVCVCVIFKWHTFKLSAIFCNFSKIKVWDLAAALDPRAPSGTLCLRTLVVCYVLTLYDSDIQINV